MQPVQSQKLRLPRRGFCHRPLGQSGAVLIWLTHVSSLTVRIRAHCHTFEVLVRFQGYDNTTPAEQALLHAKRCFVREVVLLADQKPVVAARTVVPPRHLRGAWRFMKTLGKKPLGARLFSDQSALRSPFIYGWQRGNGLRVPVRTARISLKGQSAVLSEALLPALSGLNSVQKIDPRG